ncbi:hypothetical protein A3B93_00390 [Candidatus Nomurabacteria bacterium RIFCSPHIGHO2_02_FULL_42_24]|uniref:Adenylate kinase n=1 Tax=Candidatus Nomurabacteria bacterium RIFCSPHIGHO2_02_FULL_42_24 TaxID=1801757 RepID=A0A1F6WHP7_9BACT|nr:MAG: hypothetical protein A3B93_00390 [Candidatus Nomurabacteria bacterium RIFCSPHIGHO2_02_FULL_42_24]
MFKRHSGGVKKMNLKNKNPLIIVISGTYGVGKTTLAHNLAYKLNIKQQIGLSAIAQTLRYINNKNPLIKGLGNFSNCITEKDFIKKLHTEAKLIGKILKNIIEKFIITGEHCVIDGVELLPQYLPLKKIYYITLILKNIKKHKKRFLNPSITRKKRFSNANFNAVKIIEKEILRNNSNYNTPVFESGLNEKDLADLIIKELHLKPIK